MVAYQQFVELSQSRDSEARGQAAHLAAMAFVGHSGPAVEQAALYAALIGFLDDPSVKVRAALAYGLLHAKCAPRPIMMSLLHDAPVIARAVAQYSPVLVDADLLAVIKTTELEMLRVIVDRPNMSSRIAHALLSRDILSVSLAVLKRQDVAISDKYLEKLASELSDNSTVRGVLLEREDLPAAVRLNLIEKISGIFATARIVKGAIAPRRLDRMIRDATSSALTSIGEVEAAEARSAYAINLVQNDRINARLMLHAVTSGHVLFFADCLAIITELPRDKVFTLLDRGSRAALNALFAKCGLSESMRNLMARLIFHARTADLADDLAARHFIVTSLVDEMIIEHDGVIPPSLEEAFSYLNEQNIMLARRAARGVMSAFADEVGEERALPSPEEPVLALPAA